MRILIYGLNYAPELTGIGKYTGEMAVWLTERGHDVHVVTAPPYYPAWRIRDDYRGPWYRTERIAGQPVVYRTPLYVPERPTGLKRIAHLFSFMVGSIPVMLRQAFWQPEVVFTIEPTFFGVPLTLFVAKCANAACWLHVQDFEVDAAFELGLLPGQGPVHDAALRIEKFFTFAFDRVSGISPRMVDRARAKGIPAESTVLFPNWVDVEQIHPIQSSPDRSNTFRQLLAGKVKDIDNTVVLLYSGNMGAKQGLELLAPLAEQFEKNDRVHFLFCGDGAFRKRLEQLVAHRCNVTLLPLQPLSKLNELLNAADIHLLPQRASAADLVMPSRLSAMLSSGRPVVATALPGTQVAQVVAGRGLVVAPEDARSLCVAVETLIEDKPLRLSLGRAAREYAIRHLGKQQVLEQFEQDLKAAREHV
ncbi:MAG TPA: glycosyltransferase WbuB [Acidobacteriaceae bacterium]|nr:glycosyltransferase WbuB [Acidobacteriaceae bacterium]